MLFLNTVAWIQQLCKNHCSLWMFVGPCMNLYCIADQTMNFYNIWKVKRVAAEEYHLCSSAPPTRNGC